MNKESSPSGIFVARGMTVAIVEGHISIKHGMSMTLHVHLDMCATWLEIAARHLEAARSCEVNRIAAWNTEDVAARGATLADEMESSMQTIMASAIALDAFYAIVKNAVVLPDSTIDKWRARDTPRHTQITEVLRRAFRLDPEKTKELRAILKQVFQFRDMAVHPSGKLSSPILHPELGIGVEHRFAAFRYQNAERIVRDTRAIICKLIRSAPVTNTELVRCTEGIRERIESLQADGVILPRTPAGGQS